MIVAYVVALVHLFLLSATAMISEFLLIAIVMEIPEMNVGSVMAPVFLPVTVTVMEISEIVQVFAEAQLHRVHRAMTTILTLEMMHTMTIVFV